MFENWCDDHVSWNKLVQGVQHSFKQLVDDQSEIEEGHRVMNCNYLIQRGKKHELRFQCLFLFFSVYSCFNYIPEMKKQVLHIYGSDVFGKSHFLREDSSVPSGIHRHYSFTGHLDGLNRRAWAMAAIQYKQSGFSPVQLQMFSVF